MNELSPQFKQVTAIQQKLNNTKFLEYTDAKVKQGGRQKQPWQVREQRFMYNQAMRYPKVKEWLIQQRERERASLEREVEAREDSTLKQPKCVLPASVTPEPSRTRSVNIRQKLKELIEKSSSYKSQALAMSNSVETVNRSVDTPSPSS